jgi:hypothetical protein
MHINPQLDRKLLEKTMTAVLDRVMLEDSNVEYRLVGTGAALLHGVALPAGDIDILVKERQGVEVFSDAFAGFDCLMAPIYLEDMRQYYTEYGINGVEVGVSTVEIETDIDYIETYGPGPWTHYMLLSCGSYMVPTVKLELRLITELYRNRPERYDSLIEYMSVNGYDEGLLKRGINGLSVDLQNKVLSRLNSP